MFKCIIEIYELVTITSSAHDFRLTSLSTFWFWKRNSRGEDFVKAIRIKKEEGEREKERKEGKEKRKEEKKEKWERGNDCFTMIDTCSLARLITTSLNSYAFYEFPAFFWPVPIFVHAFSIHALELRARAPVRTERRQIDLIDESNALH